MTLISTTRELQRQMNEAAARKDWRTHSQLQSRWNEVGAAEGSRRLAAELTAPTEVRMTWKLQRALKEEIVNLGRSLETAGFLRGRIVPDVFNRGTRVHITSFSNVGRRAAMRSDSSLTFSWSDLREAWSDPSVVGDWHVHVRPSSVVGPSEADLSFWRGNANEVSWRSGRAPGYIGLILGSPNDDNWSVHSLEVRAWFMPPTRFDIAESDRQPRQIPIVEADF